MKCTKWPPDSAQTTLFIDESKEALAGDMYTTPVFKQTKLKKVKTTSNHIQNTLKYIQISYLSNILGIF